MREDKKKEAAELLDLSKLAAIAAGSRGPDLAYKLYRLIPAVGRLPKSDSADADAAPSAGAAGAPDPRIDFSGVPDDPNREEPWSLAEWLQNPAEAAAQIIIAPDEGGAWRFGADTVAEGIAIPEEIRGKIPGDYGRSRGIAWYALLGFGLVHTDASQARIIKWSSEQ